MTSLWTKTVALGILAGASVLGNVALSAANQRTLVAKAGVVPAASLASVRSEPVSLDELASADSYGGFRLAALDRPRVDAGASASAMDADAEGSALPESPKVDDDSGQVVPALYAWDPDVKFVFYRHASKWM